MAHVYFTYSNLWREAWYVTFISWNCEDYTDENTKFTLNKFYSADLVWDRLYNDMPTRAHRQQIHKHLNLEFSFTDLIPWKGRFWLVSPTNLTEVYLSSPLLYSLFLLYIKLQIVNNLHGFLNNYTILTWKCLNYSDDAC